MHTYGNHWFIVASVKAKNEVLYDCGKTVRDSA